MGTSYHQIGYAVCLGIKHSPSELALLRPGMKVQVVYSINFMEMEEKRYREMHILFRLPPLIYGPV